MLSFRLITDLDRDAFCRDFSDREGAGDLFDSLLADGAAGENEAPTENGVFYALAALRDHIAVRVIENGRVFFLYPFPMCDEPTQEDLIAVLREMAEYARREEFPPCFVDVPEEEIALFRAAGFADLAIEREDGCVSVTVMNPLARLAAFPCYTGAVILDKIGTDDGADYGRLCRDAESNRYFGYDLRDDFAGEITDAALVARAQEDFERRAALDFAIRRGGHFVGEAILYAFDGLGGCEAAIRVLPEYRRQGNARAAFRALCEVGREIGLAYIDARIAPENLPSLAMMDGEAEKRGRDEKDRVFFRKALEKR